MWFERWPATRPAHAAHWSSPSFREELRCWVAGEVGAVRSLEPVKQRSWATVWRVETVAGTFYAKQNCALQDFEAGLVAALAGWSPDHVVPVAAADPERDLLLTPDHGPTLRQIVRDDLDVWSRVLAAGAELQRQVAPHAGRLAALGLTTLQPTDAAAYVAARVDQLTSLPVQDPRRLPADDAALVLDRLPAVRGWAEEVAAVGLPTTLQHNDLHANNVFARAGELRFFDFADSVLADPLGVLLIPVRLLSDALRAGPEDPRLRRFADAYLEVWSDLAPMRALRAALPAGLQLGRLARLESWTRVSASMTGTDLDEWGTAVPAWALSLRDPPPVVFDE